MTKRVNAKLKDLNNDLVIALYESRAVELLACDRARKVKARVKMLEDNVEACNSQYTKTIKEEAQIENKLRLCVSAAESELKMEKKCIVCFEEDRTNELAKNEDVIFERRKVLAFLNDQVRDKDDRLRQVRAEPTVAANKLETLQLGAEKDKEELSGARIDVSLQTTSREET